MSVAGLIGGPMSKQSEDLRDQAKRAERLAGAIGNDDTSKTLRNLAHQLEEDAERLERSRPPSAL